MRKDVMVWIGVAVTALAISAADARPDQAGAGRDSNGSNSEWGVLYEQDHESVGVGARLWDNIGNSGPTGGAFAGVTSKTSSAFTHGWHAYELRLGTGDTLRERSFWLYQDVESTTFDTLHFRCDMMIDAVAADEANVSIALLGGENRFSQTLFHVLVHRGGVLVDSPPTRRRPHSVVESLTPHRWYRFELNLQYQPQTDAEGRLVGRASMYEADKGRDKPTTIEIDLPVSAEALPLRCIKLAKSRARGIDDSVRQPHFYMDNLLIRTQ